jgi:hypothetical protein
MGHPLPADIWQLEFEIRLLIREEDLDHAATLI